MNKKYFKAIIKIQKKKEPSKLILFVLIRSKAIPFQPACNLIPLEFFFQISLLKLLFSFLASFSIWAKRLEFIRREVDFFLVSIVGIVV